MVSDVDWSTVLGGGSFLGFLAFVARDLIRAWFNRGKVSADTGKAKAEADISVSRAAVEAMERQQAVYERRIASVTSWAEAQISAVRAEAANSMAGSMHEVTTARGEASQARAQAAEARNIAERIEQLLLRVRSAVWAPGPEPLDPRVARVRDLLGDGSAPLPAYANGTPR